MTSKEMSKNTKTSIQMIADYEGDVTTLFNTMSEGEVPILATRNLVVFPGVITPILYIMPTRCPWEPISANLR